MNPITRSRVAGVVVLTVAPLWFSGCVNGNVAHRDDGNVTAASQTTAEAGLAEAQVKERAARLLRDHPGMSAKDAFKRARSEVAAVYDSPMRTRAEIEKAEAQHKFEEQLAKLDKKS